MTAPKKRGPLSGKSRPVEVMVEVLVEGRVEKVTASRAARLIYADEALPHEWTREDLAAVEDAHARRQNAQRERLERDGLLDRDGLPGPNSPRGMSLEEATSWLK